MKRLSFALLFGLCGALCWPDGYSVEKGPSPIDSRNCAIMRIFAQLWKNSPLVEQERAVWIVLDSDGEYKAIDWLRTPQRRVAVWYGELPPRIIAQAHTHGDQLNPKPSDQDVNVARNLKIPVYTLSRKAIWKVAGDGVITREQEKGWFDRTIEACGN